MSKYVSVAIVLATVMQVQTLCADEPEFMAIFMNDAKVGYTRRQRSVSDGKITHRMYITIMVTRGDTSITVTTDQQTTETTAGEPLSYGMQMVLGPMGKLSKQAVIHDGQIHLTIKMGDVTQKKILDYPKGALMVEAFTLLQRKKGLKPGTKYSFIVFEPFSDTADRHDVVIGKPTNVALIGRSERLTRVVTTVHQAASKLRLTSYVDSSLWDKKAEIPLMGTNLMMVACDKKYALSPNSKFDLLKAVAVPSPTAIAGARKLKRAKFTLKPVDKSIKLMLPDTDTQTVKSNPDATVTVSVRIGQSPKATRPYKGTDAHALAALKPTTYVQSSDPKIVAQAKAIAGNETDAMSVAIAIQDWVHDHISRKNLSVGYASAVETLQSKTGDCTEHAVLTAALCRAVGIPCRLAIGIVYVDKFADQRRCFLCHAWNQVYAGGRWVDIDAALGHADAARITLYAGADDPTDFIAITQSLGGFKITRVELAKTPTTEDAAAGD